MAKRKAGGGPEDDRSEDLDGDTSSDDDVDMLDVEFEWFDPQPDHDFHGIRTLLRQLLDVDAIEFDLSFLTNLILSQPLLGSTVKVDGNESDPYAFLTVLNLHQHRDKVGVQTILTYLQERCSLPAISTVLGAQNDTQVGLVLTERLVNVPSEIAPPMYKMLLEEIEWAVEAKEPYKFTHYLIWSKTYQETESTLDQDHDRPKRSKKSSNQTFFFHPEDEVLHQHASCHASFSFRKEQAGHSDSKRAFQELGILPRGHLILIEAARFAEAVRGVSSYFGQN